MVQIFNTVLDALLQPVPNAPIEIALFADMAGSTGGFVTASQAEIIGHWKGQANASGLWQVDLTPNASISPANTWYQVTETVPRQGNIINSFRVPASGGPYWLYDELITPPSALPGGGSSFADLTGTLNDTQHGARGSALHADSHPRQHDPIATADHTFPGGTTNFLRADGSWSPAGGGTPGAHETTHVPGGSDPLPVDAAAATGSLRTLGTGAAQAAAGNDSRLSDSRAPTAHETTHIPGGSDAMPVDAAAGTGSLRTLGTGAAQAAAGNDSRLSDSRVPTAHATTHQPSGSDAMAVDAAAGTGSLRTIGTGALQAAAGNDSRLSDSRAPTAHHTTHESGGSDIVAAVLASATGTINDTQHGSRGSSLHSDSHAALTIGTDVEHSLAGQVLSGVDASLAQKGHASFSSKFSASSGAIDLASGGHGATEHADITRSIWVPARFIGTVDSGTNASLGSVPDQTYGVSLANAATQGFQFGEVVLPKDAKASSAVNIRIVWAPSATDAGSDAVQWSVDALAIVLGTTDVRTAATPTAFTGAAQAHTIGIAYVEAATQILASASADDLLRVNVRRLGSDAADTFTQTVVLIGIFLDYTAVQ